MYSRATWGGPVDPLIMIKFLNSTVPSDVDPIVSLLIFEWQDLDLIGVADPMSPSEVIKTLLPQGIVRNQVKSK